MRWIGVVLVLIAGCGVALTDPAGRACDDSHACRFGRVCTAGRCTEPSSSAASPPAVDACGDAGPCSSDTICERGGCVSCTYVVAPDGSDTAKGTVDAPFKTLARLVDALGPGIVGCLRTGTYAADVLAKRGGSAGAPAVVRSFPGERAKLVGRLLVGGTASFFTLTQLDIDGTNPAGDSSPVILATDATIQDCDLTSTSKDGCLRLGDPSGGDASRALVRRNRIHDCGVASTNSASGVKVAYGGEIRIVDNTIFGSKDHGILFYPKAQGSLATGNVIDGNGTNVVFGGDDTDAVSGIVVERNLITFPIAADNVGSFFGPGPVGHDNVVRHNCLFAGANDGGVPPSPIGFTASDNVIADPGYVNRSARDLRLQPSSPCAAVLLGP